MILRSEANVTAAVLDEVARTSDPRLREVLGAAVRHLHAFVRETRLTEAEFQQACACIAQLGQRTSAAHNEVVLCAGSLGVSSLVCLLNNTAGTQTPTTANLLGPFWRPDSPAMAQGASIVRSPTPGTPIFVTARVVDREGRPVAGAEVDVWHASTEGWYENQDPKQAEMNLRGKFTADAEGCVRLRSVKPAGYPIPVDGPVGALLRAQGRGNLRPAHLHFLIFKPGYKTQCSQVYSRDDPHLNDDVQFGVTAALVGDYVLHDEAHPSAPDVTGAWCTLEHTFVIDKGEAQLPRAPITAKAGSGPPALTVLPRR